ncbi:MAG TPA: hypothetical protein VFF02_08445 [Anaeromyxobacteraceae bacterium]|nr:hypothetical protein [Anaeromyxobacteraceae bacterium]
MIRLFDWLEQAWESAVARRFVTVALVAAFLATLLAVELARHGLLPPALAAAAGGNHFHAVQVAFYLLLAYEVLGLVFGLARSVSNATGKQLEIFSLILLRQSFEAFGHLQEPLRWEQVRGAVAQMASDGVGALAIFVTLGFYYRLQRHRPASGSDPRDRATFIAAKKVIALLLLAVFLLVGGRVIVTQAFLGRPTRFFEEFYTLLIFADILIVLLAVRYSSTYRVVFRNSGLAVSTVLLRLALSAPVPVNAVLGVVAALFATGLTLAYNAFGIPPGEKPSPPPGVAQPP